MRGNRTIPQSRAQTTLSGSARLTVRRLTPLECERLQGFPDGWTDIQWRGREHAPDGPRYKALGNSMAVPVMRWIGEGIQLVEDNKELFKKETK
ncbi:DNA cytosine methyltransferase [Bifidobacterium pseudocatenulatum]|uniref:DNA cytosine methyltransferase n=1 Tax=Bifidobacterium pseudocatenulatum TaxID=28026 RepID=UPI0022E689F3|nr:DNA cytosine methyltransferase [Bifidobacterium pseudocatenulatum]